MYMNSNYRYILEPYKSGAANKYECPHCGKRKCFTRYIDTETGNHIGDAVGRCDHEQSCGYHYTPKDYFHDHPKENDWQHERKPFVASKPKKVEPIKPKTPGTIDKSYMTRSHSRQSQFMQWLASLGFDAESIDRVFEDYKLGATRDGGVIFWQIDRKGLVRTGKVMHYWSDGHRIRDNEDYAMFLGVPYSERIPHPSYFIHTMLQKQKVLTSDWQLTQCLFGEHLIDSRPDDIVCVVESEKTAIVCALYYPQFVWLASGGSNGLNKWKLAPLRGRRVIVYPDSGELKLWTEKMAETEGINYSIVADLEGCEHNTDIADLLLDQHKATKANDTERKPEVQIEEERQAIDDELFTINPEPCPF